MPTVSLNDRGKAQEGPIRFSFGSAESFDLEGGGTVDTDDRDLIANAERHPFLQVNYPEGNPVVAQLEKAAEEARASDDPFVNRSKDHLSAEADPEVVKAAQENNERIRAEAAGEKPRVRRGRKAAQEQPQPPTTSTEGENS